MVISGDDTSAKQQVSEFDAASVPGAYSNISYRYFVSKPPIAGGDVSMKRIEFIFRDNVLISYNFTSNFVADSSNFDESKLASLQKHQTTQTQVEQILGQPTGQAVYPAVLIDGDRKAYYSYLATTVRSITEQIQLVIVYDMFGTVG